VLSQHKKASLANGDGNRYFYHYISYIRKFQPRYRQNQKIPQTFEKCAFISAEKNKIMISPEAAKTRCVFFKGLYDEKSKAVLNLVFYWKNKQKHRIKSDVENTHKSNENDVFLRLHCFFICGKLQIN
jgi:hypothetical protein